MRALDLSLAARLEGITVDLGRAPAAAPAAARGQWRSAAQKVVDGEARRRDSERSAQRFAPRSSVAEASASVRAADGARSAGSDAAAVALGPSIPLVDGGKVSADLEQPCSDCF